MNVTLRNQFQLLRHRECESLLSVFLHILRFLHFTSGHSEGLHSGLQTEDLVSLPPAQGKVPGLVAESALGESSVGRRFTAVRAETFMRTELGNRWSTLSALIVMQVRTWLTPKQNGAHSRNAHFTLHIQLLHPFDKPFYSVSLISSSVLNGSSTQWLLSDTLSAGYLWTHTWWVLTKGHKANSVY